MTVTRKWRNIVRSMFLFLLMTPSFLPASETASKPAAPAQFAANSQTETINAARQNLQIEHVRQILATTKDFSGKNLSYLELKQFDFSGANLIDANLSYADLYGANFSNANLTRANMRGAALEKADFSGANMREVQLNDARLFGANFEGTDLEHAKMRRCYADKANFQKANLKCADLGWSFFAGAKNVDSNFEGANIEGTIFEQGKEKLQGISTGRDICVQTADNKQSIINRSAPEKTGVLEKSGQQKAAMAPDMNKEKELAIDRGLADIIELEHLATRKLEEEQAAATAEATRLAAAKQQAEKEKAEQELLSRESAEKEKAEIARIAAEKAEQESIAAASAEAARLAAARQDQESVTVEKSAAEIKGGNKEKQQEAVATETKGAPEESIVSSEKDKQQNNEEKLLVLLDPTVSPPKKWSAGGNFELWYVSQDYNTNIGSSSSSGTIEDFKPGFSAFVGYDDFTLQLSYKYGEFSADNTVPNYNYNYTKTIKESEFELALRYIFHKSRWLNPYLIVGYNNLDRKITTALNTNQVVLSASGGNSVSTNSSHNSLLTGIGSIVPVNELLGLRMDYRLLFDYYQGEGPNVNEKHETFGFPMRLTLTGYWNIYKGLNLQLGTRYDYFPGIVNYGASRERLGTFSSFGYTYKF